jgi:hypothetical protein
MSHWSDDASSTTRRRRRSRARSITRASFGVVGADDTYALVAAVNGCCW